MFNERKVTQMAAFFLLKENCQMAHLKLMKLLYLADRTSFDEYEISMSGDKFYSLPHGPVLTLTKELMDGERESCLPDSWDDWISDKENHTLKLKVTNITRNNLDELSDAEIEILQNIWDKFGSMDKWAIRNYTHEHCPEWRDPNNSSYPISLKDIFKALGRNDSEIAEIEANIREQEYIQSMFAV